MKKALIFIFTIFFSLTCLNFTSAAAEEKVDNEFNVSINADSRDNFKQTTDIIIKYSNIQSVRDLKSVKGSLLYSHTDLKFQNARLNVSGITEEDYKADINFGSYTGGNEKLLFDFTFNDSISSEKIDEITMVFHFMNRGESEKVTAAFVSGSAVDINDGVLYSSAKDLKPISFSIKNDKTFKYIICACAIFAIAVITVIFIFAGRKGTKNTDEQN